MKKFPRISCPNDFRDSKDLFWFRLQPGVIGYRQFDQNCYCLDDQNKLLWSRAINNKLLWSCASKLNYYGRPIKINYYRPVQLK